MPYAVAHVILTIVVADIYRDYFAKKKFPMIYVLIAGIAGLLPDADIPAGWIFNSIFGADYSFHRIYTHSLIYGKQGISINPGVVEQFVEWIRNVIGLADADQEGAPFLENIEQFRDLYLLHRSQNSRLSL